MSATMPKLDAETERQHREHLARRARLSGATPRPVAAQATAPQAPDEIEPEEVPGASTDNAGRARRDLAIFHKRNAGHGDTFTHSEVLELMQAFGASEVKRDRSRDGRNKGSKKFREEGKKDASQPVYERQIAMDTKTALFFACQDLEQRVMATIERHSLIEPNKVRSLKLLRQLLYAFQRKTGHPLIRWYNENRPLGRPSTQGDPRLADIRQTAAACAQYLIGAGQSEADACNEVCDVAAKVAQIEFNTSDLKKWAAGLTPKQRSDAALVGRVHTPEGLAERIRVLFDILAPVATEDHPDLA